MLEGKVPDFGSGASIYRNVQSRRFIRMAAASAAVAASMAATDLAQATTITIPSTAVTTGPTLVGTASTNSGTGLASTLGYDGYQFYDIGGTNNQYGLTGSVVTVQPGYVSNLNWVNYYQATGVAPYGATEGPYYATSYPQVSYNTASNQTIGALFADPTYVSQSTVSDSSPQATIVTFTLGSTAPQEFQIALLEGIGNNFNNSSDFIVTDTSAPGAPYVITTSANTAANQLRWYYVDVTGASPGDTISVSMVRVGTNQADFGGIAFDTLIPAATPEPTSCTLFGFAALGLLKRRRRQAAL